MPSYSELLRHPMWQKKCAEIRAMDNFLCVMCQDPNEPTDVHHIYYDKDTDPWDYPDDALISLCPDCHKAVEEVIREFRKIIGRHTLSLMRSFLVAYANADGLGLSEKELWTTIIALLSHPNWIRDIKDELYLNGLETLR